MKIAYAMCDSCGDKIEDPFHAGISITSQNRCHIGLNMDLCENCAKKFSIILTGFTSKEYMEREGPRIGEII